MTPLKPAILAGLALFAIAPSVACCAPRSPTGAAAKIAALKELRDSGVITPDQYAQQAAQLQASAETPKGAPPVMGGLGGGGESHDILDPQTGLAAVKVTAPRGWQVHGQTMHDDTSCAAPADGVMWHAESPDGAYGKEVTSGNLAAYLSNGGSMGDEVLKGRGCLVYGSSAAEGFLRDVWAPRMRPGAKVTETTPAPLADIQPLRDKAGLAPGSELNAGRIKLIGEENGRSYEEWVVAMIRCDHKTLPGLRGATVQSMYCVPFAIQSERGPPGKVEDFDAHLASQIGGQDDPAYVERIKASIPGRGQAILQRLQAKYTQENRAITAQINGDRQAQLAQGQANLDMIHRTGAAIMNNGRASADALHQSSQAFARSMGDNANFQGPNGQTFNASNQYSHTYVGPNGRVLQTNSAYAPPAGYTETQGR